jgi:hypothetical protein
MTLAALISAVVGTLALAGALTAWPFVALPRWRKHRMLVPVAVTAGLYALCNIFATNAYFSDRALVLFSRAQGVMLSLHVAAWLKYAEDDLGPLPRGLGTVARFGMFLMAALVLVPGVIYDGRVGTHSFPELGITYRDVLPTSFGAVYMAAIIAGLLLVAISYADAAVRGVPHAPGHFIALLGMLVCGANDAIVSFGASPMPYLLDIGIFVQMLVLFLVMTRRWAADLGALAGLPGRPRGLTETSNPGKK